MGGKSGVEGNTIIEFVKELQAGKVLAPNCRMIFTSCQDERWPSALKNFNAAFGKACRIGNMDNPLFKACEDAENVNCVHHAQNLKRLSGLSMSFLQFNVNKLKASTKKKRVCGLGLGGSVGPA